MAENHLFRFAFKMEAEAPTRSRRRRTLQYVEESDEEATKVYA
jgi:hypothetical protein